MNDYPYEFAFSFAGTDRDRVVTVFEHLERALGKGRVFYDRSLESEIHGVDMHKKLAGTYTGQARIVVVFLSKGYYQRPWCMVEWNAITEWADRELRVARDPVARLRLALLRMDDCEIKGLGPYDQHQDAFRLTNKQIARYLLDRHAGLWGHSQYPGTGSRIRGLLPRAMGGGIKRAPGHAPSPPSRIETPCGCVLVPVAGSAFRMGTPNAPEGSDERYHDVLLTRGFHIAATPVTQDQWRAVMGRVPGAQPTPTGDHPVVNVSWLDACAFCDRLSEMDRPSGRRYRLPTEAEWEFACRGDPRSSDAYPWGSSPKGARGHANLFDRSASRAHHRDIDVVPWDDGYPTTSPVGAFAPNRLGLSDMIGNVWEWCADRYAPYRVADLENPSGPADGTRRVLRGASWHDGLGRARTAVRDKLEPERSHSTIGFRIAL